MKQHDEYITIVIFVLASVGLLYGEQIHAGVGKVLFSLSWLWLVGHKR